MMSARTSETWPEPQGSGWVARVHVSAQWIRVTVQGPEGEAILRARMDRRPARRRALLELLEALAQWQGRTLDAVLSVAGWAAPVCDSASWVDAVELGPSALVRVCYGAHGSRQLRLGEGPAELAAARAGKGGDGTMAVQGGRRS